MAWWDRVDWSDPIERDCPLNQGLVGWWMGAPNCYGGTRLQDLLNRNHGTLTDMDPATDWVGTEHGAALDFDGTDDHVVTAFNPLMTGRVTLTAIFYAHSVRSAYQFVASSDSNNGASGVSIGTDSSNRIYVTIANGYQNASTTYSANTAYCVTVSGSLGSGSRPLMWINGIAQTSGAGSVISGSTTGGSLYIGRRPYSVARNFFGRTSLVICHDTLDDGTLAISLYNQLRTGFPDALRWLKGRSMVSVPAAGGGATPWLYARRQTQIIGGGMGL